MCVCVSSIDIEVYLKRIGIRKHSSANSVAAKQGKKKYFMREQYSRDSNIICAAFEKSSITICFVSAFFSLCQGIFHPLNSQPEMENNKN